MSNLNAGVNNTAELFVLAARNKFRFPSPQGPMNTEQLWDLPLTHRAATAASLDGVARAVNTELKAVTEDSFVAVRRSDQQELLSAKLEIVKHIIAVKLDEQKAREQSAARATEKARLLEVLARKDGEALEGLSREEILQKLSEIGA
jgi:hypothetical protein